MKKRPVEAVRMAALVKAWRRSGQSLSAFARTRGVGRDKLEYWRRRLGVPSRRAQAVATIQFSPVQVSVDTERAVIEVWLPGDVRVAIRSGAEEAVVRAVMGGLGRTC